ncbi:RBBP8 N-terminal-like protein isoform X1 [Arapaima gigas]
MALESFSELLHKLKALHEREVEGWQERVLELTNQKCCDTKRMEELFSKNQQLREQQKALTENIKQLENRLRAGLCDRCTVTQDVAKRKQQEYESSQIQSLQHISVLASEMNALRKENKRLQEEVKNLRGLIEGQNGHSSQVSTPESGTPPGAAAAVGKTYRQPAVKNDPDSLGFLSAEEKLQGCRKPQAWSSQETYLSNKLQANAPSISLGQRVENTPSRGYSGVKRTRSMETMEPLHPPGSPSHLPVSPLLLLKNFHLPASSPSASSVSTWDEKPGAHLNQTPVIYRPRPIKSTRLSLPYSLSEHQDWATWVSSPAFMERKLLEKERFCSEGTDNHFHSRGRKCSPELLLSATHPLSEASTTGDAPWKGRTKEKEAALSLWKCSDRTMDKTSEKSSPEAAGEAPLDLSDPRRSQPSEQPKAHKPNPFLPEEDPEEAEGSSKLSTLKSPLQAQTSPPSRGPAHPLPTAAPSPPSPSEELPPPVSGKHQQKQEEELNGRKEDTISEVSPKAEQKKVPVLTLSLRPVVVLETMKEGMETQESSDQEMPMALHLESRPDDPLDEVHSSPERSQNGRRTRRGPSLGRDAVLQRRSPKDRRGKLTLSHSNTDS